MRHFGAANPKIEIICEWLGKIQNTKIKRKIYKYNASQHNNQSSHQTID